MAEHSVVIRQIPAVELLHKDMEIAVSSDGVLLGRLTVSKGGIGWYPSNASQERHFSWEQFARIVAEQRG